MPSSGGLVALLSIATGLGCMSCSSQDNTVGSSKAPAPEPQLPAAPASCPVLQTGTVNVLGVDVQMFVGQKQSDKKGPVLFYWHGTGSFSGEISTFLNTTGNPILDEIQSEGGIAASFTATIGTGDNTGNNVWFTGDYDVADAILACAVQQLNIDTRRIYAAGCSAGGLESGTMALERSSYLAAVIPNSGGHILPVSIPFQDPAHIPAVMTVHGTYDNDVVLIHFSDTSHHLDQEIVGAGGLSLDCEHPNGHCMIFSPTTIPSADLIDEVSRAQWQFLKDHPFGTKVDPYTGGLPAVFPSFCQDVNVSGDI